MPNAMRGDNQEQAAMGGKTHWFKTHFALDPRAPADGAEPEPAATEPSADHYRRLLSTDPGNREALQGYAGLLLKQRRYGQAYSLYERLVRADEQAGRIDRAAALLTRLCDLVPGDDRPRERLIRLLVTAARRRLGTAPALRYRDMALVELRRLLNRQGVMRDPDNDIRYLRTVVNLDPRDLGAARRLAQLLHGQGRTDEGLSFLQNQAERLLRRNLPDVAEKVIYEGLTLQNGNPVMKALFYLAQVHQGFGRGVLIGLDRLQRQNAENRDVLQIAARVKLFLGDHEAAVRALQALFRQDPGQGRLLLDTARTLAASDKPDPAFELLHTVALYGLRVGKAEVGLRLMEPFHRKFPDHVPCRQALVLYYLRAGMPDKVPPLIDQILETAGDGGRLEEVRRFLDRLKRDYPEVADLLGTARPVPTRAA